MNPKLWVNAVGDAPDAKPGDGVCRTKALTKPGAKPVCTLRAAIQTANARPGPDVVMVPAGTFALSRLGPDEELSRTGDLDISTGPTVVLGKGPGLTVVDGLDQDRLFDVHGFGGSLVLRGVTLTRGLAPGGKDEEDGGGIRVVGSLVLGNAVVRESRGSHSMSRGGGIQVDALGRVELDRVSLVGNQAARGAALFVEVGAEAVLRNTTVSGNGSTNPQLGSDVTVKGRLRLTHTTVVSAGPWAIRYDAASARVEQFASVIVGECNARDGEYLGTGDITTSAGCAPYFTATNGGVSDTVFADAGLLPLTDGPLPVHPLAAGSPAIDRARAVPELCPPVDALGRTRPFGRACDAGAFEYRVRRAA